MTKKAKISRFLKILLAALLTLIIATWIFVLKLKPKTKILKIGVMPDLDSVQVAVALSFCENVELVLFTDALSRSSAFRSGAVDLCVSDLLTAVSEISGGRKDKVLTTTTGRYSLISTKNDIAEINTVGISIGTVIEYTADKIFDGKPVQKIPIGSIPSRVAAVNGENVSGAVLPEPFASFSLSKKTNVLAEYTEQNVGIISCNKKAFNKKRRLIDEFLNAYGKASELINNSPDSPLVKEAMERLNIGEAFLNITLPTYRGTALPDQKAIDNVCEYLSENNICTPNRRLLEKALSN